MPWRIKRRQPEPDGLDAASAIDDPISCLIVLAVVVVLLFFPIVFAILFAPFEILVLLLLLPFAVVVRVLSSSRWPWQVELRRGWRPWTEVHGGDWRTSALRIHQRADAVRRGEIPPRTLGADPPG